MTNEEDYIFGEMPSEEDLIRMNYRIQHYINVMQGPQWQAICQLGPIEEFEDPFEDPNELAKFMISEYREWFHFLTSDGEEINAELFLHDDVQELVYDDSVNDLISSAPNLPKVSLLGQRPVKNCKMYLAPNIPEKKLNNGISNNRFRVNGMLKETDVFALLDQKTWLSTPKCGLMITNIGIFWRGDYQYGGLPWRFGESRMTDFVFIDGPIGSKSFAIIIDDEFLLPIGGLGLVYHPEAEYISTLIHGFIEIAQSQYDSST